MLRRKKKQKEETPKSLSGKERERYKDEKLRREVSELRKKKWQWAIFIPLIAGVVAIIGGVITMAIQNEQFKKELEVSRKELETHTEQLKLSSKQLTDQAGQHKSQIAELKERRTTDNITEIVLSMGKDRLFSTLALDFYVGQEAYDKHQERLTKLVMAVLKLEAAREQPERNEEAIDKLLSLADKLVSRGGFLDKEIDTTYNEELATIVSKLKGEKLVRQERNLYLESIASKQKEKKEREENYRNQIKKFQVSGKAGIDLSEEDLRNINLSELNLRYANLKRAKLEGADLTKTVLAGANLSNANLEGATLNSANLSGANLTGANLKNADLTDANLKNATVSRVDWTHATLQGADFEGVNDFEREATLYIRELRCVRKQDSNRYDECKLTVKIDGAELKTLEKYEMEEGKTWDINREFPFTRTVEIELWELDKRSNDDLLGRNKILPIPANGAEAVFPGEDGEEGYYVLTYDTY